MKSILALDPGESTGWCFRDQCGSVYGGTARKNHVEVATLIRVAKPDIVVVERFNLYPSKAKSLSWNSFYPCEVIGVIKLVCMELGVPVVEQAPSVKRFFGGFLSDWENVSQVSEYLNTCTKGVTEHTKDAYMHLQYFIRNGLKKFNSSV